MSQDIPMPMPMPMPNMPMMHMTFFWGKNVVMLLDEWPNGRLGMYILALALVFVLAIIVEFLKVFPVIKTGTSPFISGLVQASFYGLRMALAYIVMLSVMSYNLGVFIFAVAGHAAGFFLLKYRAASKAKDDPL